MLLTIDIGNTQTSFGVFERQNAPEGLVATWRVSTHAQATPDELAVQMIALLATHGLALADIEAVCLGSVVPKLSRAWIRACADRALPVPLLPSEIAPHDLGLTSGQCAMVGADRLANVVAARARYGAPAIVVDFGTATNLDVIDAAGHFIGGPISAGLELSAAALYAQAARLTAIELAAPTRIIAQTTEDALRAGLVVGEAAKVDGLVTRIADELGGAAPAQLTAGKLPVIATGGLADLIAPHSRTITVIAPTLTLEGLYVLAHDALQGTQA